MPTRISNAPRTNSVSLSSENAPLKKHNENAKNTISTVAPAENAKKRSGVAEFFSKVWNWILQNIFCCFVKAPSKPKAESVSESETIDPKKTISTSTESSPEVKPNTVKFPRVEKKADPDLSTKAKVPTLIGKKIEPFTLLPTAKSLPSFTPAAREPKVDKPSFSQAVSEPNVDIVHPKRASLFAVSSISVSSPPAAVTPKIEPLKFVGVKNAVFSESLGVGTTIVSTFSQMFDPPLMTRDEAINNNDKSVDLSGDCFRIDLSFCGEKAKSAWMASGFHGEYRMGFMDGSSDVSIRKPSDYLTFMAKECKLESEHIRDFLNTRHKNKQLSDEGYEKAWTAFVELYRAGVIHGHLSEQQIKDAKHLREERKVTAQQSAPVQAKVEQMPQALSTSLPKSETVEVQSSLQAQNTDGAAKKTALSIDSALAKHFASAVDLSTVSEKPDAHKTVPPVRLLLSDSGSAILPSPKASAAIATAMTQAATSVSAAQSILSSEPSKEKPATRFVGKAKEMVLSKKCDMETSIISTFSQMFDPPLLTPDEARTNVDMSIRLTRDGLAIPLSFCKDRAESVWKAFEQAVNGENYESIRFIDAGRTILIKEPRDYLSFLHKFCNLQIWNLVDLLNFRRDAKELSDEAFEAAWSQLIKMCESGDIFIGALSIDKIASKKGMTTQSFSLFEPSPRSSPKVSLPLEQKVSPLENKQSDAKNTTDSKALSGAKTAGSDDDEEEFSTPFAKVDSSRIWAFFGDEVLIPPTGESRSAFRKSAAEGKYKPAPLVIGKNSMVSDDILKYMMRCKKDEAIGVKYVPGDSITNMLAALHTVVVPVGAIKMTGDYQWKGMVAGDSFKHNQYRNVVLSASIHPDFETDEVIMALISVGEDRVAGQSFPGNKVEVPSPEILADANKVKEYDARIRSHMIYHLTQKNELPALADIKKENILDYKGAITYLEELLNNPQTIFGLKDKFLKVGTKVLSLEMLFNLYVEQTQAEFTVLNKNLPQGFIHTIDPPSIFARKIGGAEVLNRLQALAFLRLDSSLISKELYSNLKMIGYNDFADKKMIELFQKAMPNVKVVSKATLFDASGKYVFDASSKHGSSNGLAVVFHNCSDGLGQNIETEDQTSTDGIFGNFSDASVLLDRNRSDLCANIVETD